jgi:CheY-like chemotaxis protein
MRKAKILAVDDNMGNLIALTALLGTDYDVTTATSGEEALALIRASTNIDLILMDVQMPGMDGFECATRIKQTEHAREIPIIFVTAVYQDDPYVKRGYAVGGVDYFSKPFDPDLLKLKVGIYASVRQRAELLRERELRVRESEELLQAGRKSSAFLETVPVGVLIADVDGRIVQANEQIARIFRSSELTAHDDYGAILGWWDAEGRMIKEESGPLCRAIAGIAAHNVKLSVHALDGTPTTLVCSASPLLGRAGEIVGAVVVLQDLTAAKRVEQEIEDRLARLVTAGVQLEQAIEQ